MIESKELAKKAVVTLDKHKGLDITVIGVEDITVITDYFVIAAATSTTQVKALVDYVEHELKEEGIVPLRTEGERSSGWVLIDYGTVIVNIFMQETRKYYDLERLWKDGKQLDTAEFLK